MPRVALHTLGCKLNYAETATLGQQFLERGFELVEFGLPADVCVINTCSVTGRADRECRQMIRRALRTGENPYVIVTGCYAQLQPEEVASINGVDLVLGAKEKFDLFRFAGEFAKTHVPRVHVSEISGVNDFGPAFSTEASGRTRAYLKVQDGCDYSCSFCTIPLARGGSRSQSVDETVRQARALVLAGYREIVLTGVNVGDYGGKTGSSLAILLRALEVIEGLDRIRISSIEPNLLSPEIIEMAKNRGKLCPHFHIPLQSGSDQILRLMRRRYTAGQYRELIDAVRDTLPDAGIGVDVITGFPGETDEHFENTYRFLTELPVSYLHAFTYSERPGTPAADMGAPVDPSTRFRRNEMLRLLSRKKREAFYRSAIGRNFDVLVEGNGEPGRLEGFTDTYIRVSLPADAAQENEIVRVNISGSDGELCTGALVPEGVTR